ncbi:MAG: aminotransferase class V-fold PLP-dependent enzyme [Deferribacteraceae bacterium]|jgi:selenocysteine lyase/cysteine desulfurase|nr:aminotransferase class V-fold PLP-dependent enzyme [Deferribacteraceae bacterium]
MRIVWKSDEINFDNAATTPPLRSVIKAVREFAPIYASVHRGNGKHSRLSSELYEASRYEIMDFFGASAEQNTLIYLKNTTEAINKLSNRLSRSSGKKDTVIATRMEHHSNDLPWRRNFKVLYAGLTPSGRLDLEDLEIKLKENAGRVRLVAVTAASNVTGYVNPLHQIAEISHRYGAEIFADCAQYTAHLPLDMKDRYASDHIDYIAFSSHKMYAPFGIGVLIGHSGSFTGEPDCSGGGTVKFVTEGDVIWDDPPHNEEGGTPNLIGVVALLAAIKSLKTFGMRNIGNREAELSAYAFEKLSGIKGIKLYSDRSLPRIGVITFNLKDIFHEDLSAALSDRAGIAVRSGCFCAQPYVQNLLRLSGDEILKYKHKPLSERPGMVRVSFGFYNRKKEVDLLIDSLQEFLTEG